MEETLNILVVDDESILRNLLDRILKKDGHNVFLAASGKEGLETLRKNPIDIVLSDVKMPEMDGFQFLIAAKKEFPHVGVIMMTAYDDSYSVKDALLLDAEDYITKPFKNFEISMIIERAYWHILANREKQNNITTDR